jgi:hypothetical protein
MAAAMIQYATDGDEAGCRSMIHCISRTRCVSNNSSWPWK